MAVEPGTLSSESIFGITMSAEGWAVVAWRDDDGNYVDAELDPNSPDVKEALALIRKIIWG